jgi:ribonuclease HI
MACLKADPPLMVSAFIDDTSAVWKKELLEEYFLPMDVEVIMSIPLSTRRLEDRWAWHYEKSGILTVRSVYRLLVQTKKRREDWLEGRSASSGTAAEGKAWQRLWKVVQVPSKLRIFLWRLAHQSLPTGDVRRHRHMADTSACSLCGAEDSWRHSLLSCTIARSVWALADEGIAEHVCMNEFPTAKVWLFDLMETLPRSDFARVAVTLWAIWYARRKMIHEDVFQSPLSTHLFIEAYLRDLDIVNSVAKVAPGTAQPIHPKWIPPRSGCAKLNVDAAMAKTRPGGAVGVVCRDETGLFLGASTLTIPGIIDPAVMEALACREALALAQDLHLQRVTIATDCLAVLNDMQRPFAGRYSMILEEIKANSGPFGEAVFRHENRASNQEAHRLARSATSADFGHQVWLLEPPDLCISNIMRFE